MFSQRVIHSDNGTLRDLSASLSNFHSEPETLAIVASEDKLYIGSEFPFNHKYFHIDSANAVASAISVEVWDGDEWKACVDVFDGTSVGGKTLARSGIISWWMDKDEAWLRDDTNRNGEYITGLSGVTIYDLYWVRISFSSSLTGTTSIRHVGQKFSTIDDLRDEYPALVRPDVIQSIETGKTDYIEQELRAGELIVEHMKNSGVIHSRDQILSYDIFKTASVHRIAELIYSAFGPQAEESRALAMNKFKKAMDMRIFRIDENNSGALSVAEKVQNQGWLKR